MKGMTGRRDNDKPQHPLPTAAHWKAISLACLLALPATGVFAVAAKASQLIARDATNVALAVNSNGEALVTYREAGTTHHVLGWGAINANPPSRDARQVKLQLDYSGGWRSRHQQVWDGFVSACQRYDGPPLHWLVTACKAPDGSYWALQAWQRSLPDLGLTPATPIERSWDLRLSHWTVDTPKLWISADWAYRRYHHLFGSFVYAGYGVYGFRATPSGAPLDDFGRNLYVDTFNSAYGPGWKRENSFLTHPSGGTFCYGFYPHGHQPTGTGSRYRATIIGPGVTPDAYWEAPAPGPYNPPLERQAGALQASLFTNDKSCRPL